MLISKDSFVRVGLGPGSYLTGTKALFFSCLMVFTKTILCNVSMTVFASPGGITPNKLANITAVLGCVFSLPVNVVVFIVGVPLFV